MDEISTADWITKNKAIGMVSLLVLTVVLYIAFDVDYEKCEDRDNCLVIAFEVQDTYLIWDKNPQHLADKMESLTGMDVEIYPVTDSVAAIEAVDKGNADLAFMDGASAWLAWEIYGLEVLAAEQKSDGRIYYNATAWVRADSDMALAYLDDDDTTDPFALMEGKTSCHTGWLKSAGMLIPMGYLIANGYAEVIGDANEIESLRDTVTTFFSKNSSIPEGGTPYSSYKGALRCLSDGTGDVTLAKDSVVNSYCTGDDAEDWCLEVDEYVMLPPFGQAPSHPALYNPDTMDEETVVKVQNALVSLNDDSEGKEILSDLLNTDGMVITNSTTHLGTYGAAVSNVPGIQAYLS
jgi:ABC-type phosphate/phosphonate transport system substrate-binding protein